MCVCYIEIFIYHQKVQLWQILFVAEILKYNFTRSYNQVYINNKYVYIYIYIWYNIL